MKFRMLRLSNYGSFYGDHEFRLAGRGLVLVSGANQDEPAMNSNGSGKSTLFDALDWCLWGQNPRKDAAQGVMNEEAATVRGAQCAVTVELEDDRGRPVEIQRSRSKSKTELQVRVGGEDRSTLDTRETQTEIERILGLDREVFHSTVLFAQTDLTHYADSTDSERMEILTRLLQLEELDEYRDRAKESLRAQQDLAVQAGQEVSGIQGQIEALKSQDYRSLIDSWEAQRAQRAQQAQQQIVELEQQRAAMEADRPDVEWLRAQKVAADEAASQAQQLPHEPPEIEHWRQEHTRLNSELAVVRSRWAEVDRAWKRMSELGEGICPHCHQPITAEHRGQELARLDAERSAVQAEGEGISQQAIAAASQIETYVSRHREQVVEHKAHQARLVDQAQQLGQQLAAAEQWQYRYDLVGRHVQERKADLDRVTSEQNPHIAVAERRDRQVYDLERKLGQANFTMTQISEDKRYTEFWVSALGTRGLKSYILDHRLQELTDSANRWLRQLTGGTMWVRFEAQRQTQKKMVNAPEIRVFRWNPDQTITERPYRRWSGGEKQRISWAVDFGLSQLLASRSSSTYNLLILDEIFRHLDSAGKESVLEILQHLAAEKDSLIVVEHDDQFRAQFEREVTVRKVGGRSRIEEERGGQEKEELSEVVPGDPVGTGRSGRCPVRRPVT